jgi:hypothetical protein
MNPAALEGLKKWASRRKTTTIAEHLAKHEVDDPKALAVWIRKRAIGEAQFRENQRIAREKKRKRG